MKIQQCFASILLLFVFNTAHAQNDAHATRAAAISHEDAGQAGEDASASELIKGPAVQRYMWSDGRHEMSLLVFARPDPQKLVKLQNVRDALHQSLAEQDPLDVHSQIFAINQSPDATVVLQPEIYDLIFTSLSIAQASRGAYNPSIFALRQAWRFYENGRIPSSLALENALGQVSFTAIHLDAKDHSLRRLTPVLLDLSPVSKGRSLDLTAKIIRKTFGENFVLRIDNSVLVSGKKAGAPWSIGVEDPRSTAYFAAIPSTVLGGEQLALTSISDAQHFFFASATRYHDVIDPRSGQPAALSRSVTVLGPRADMAGGLAYAVFVLGAQKGLKLIDQNAGYAAIIVDKDNRVWMSANVQGKISYRPPTDAP